MRCDSRSMVYLDNDAPEYQLIPSSSWSKSLLEVGKGLVTMQLQSRDEDSGRGVGQPQVL